MSGSVAKPQKCIGLYGHIIYHMLILPLFLSMSRLELLINEKDLSFGTFLKNRSFTAFDLYYILAYSEENVSAIGHIQAAVIKLQASHRIL